MEEDNILLNKEYKLGDYEGPLDLLLDLIKRSRIDIYDIPIAQLTGQYILYLETADEEVTLEELAEFYGMAAELLYIKSRMLLPHEVESETVFEDPRKNLVERLIEYQKFKKYSELLEKCRVKDDFSAVRKPSGYVIPFSDKDLISGCTVEDLASVFREMLSRVRPESVVFNIFEGVTVREKTALLSELLEKKNTVLFSELVVHPDSREHVVCAFMAILDAAHSGMVRLLQKIGSTDIELVGNNVSGGDDGR